MAAKRRLRVERPKTHRRRDIEPNERPITQEQKKRHLVKVLLAEIERIEESLDRAEGGS